MYNTLPLHLASHYGYHILNCIIPHQTPSLVLFHTTPHSASHHSSPSRPFHIAPAPLAAHFHFTIFEKSHHIGHITPLSSHCTPFHITDVPHNATSVSDHILATFYTTLLRHFTYSPSCIIPPHLTDHTQFYIPLPCFT